MIFVKPTPPCESPGGAAIIDDDADRAHAIFSWRRTSQVLIAGMLGLVPMAALDANGLGHR